jgi:hypothetical protein
MEKARGALDKKRNADSQHDQLREASMAREIHPEMFKRVSRAVRSAAEGVSRRCWWSDSPAPIAQIAEERSTTQSRSGRGPKRGVAVGTAIARRPPHRSRRAPLTHRAPTSGHDVEPPVVIGCRNFGLGSQRSAIRIIFRHVSLCRWLRRRRQRSQCQSTW